MKTLIVILILSLSSNILSISQEYETLQVEWKKLDIQPFEYQQIKTVVTYKDEILTSGPFRYSNDKGHTFKNYFVLKKSIIPGVPDYIDYMRTGIDGYAYDNMNGLYLIYDNYHYNNYDREITLNYFVPERDTVLEILNFPNRKLPDDFDPTPIKVQFIYLMNNNKLFFGTNYEAWIYDIESKTNTIINFVDSLVISHHKGDINNYAILFSDYDKSNNIMKIYYGIHDGVTGMIKYKYSSDNGVNWFENDAVADCIPSDIPDFMRSFNSIYFWNQDEYRYMTSIGEPLYRYDRYCNKKDLKVGYRLGSDLSFNDFALIYPNKNNLVLFGDSDELSLLYSNNNGDNFYKISDFPIPDNEIRTAIPSVFSDGSLLLSIVKKNDNSKMGELYYGTPIPNSVNSPEKSININISPNPTSDFFTLSLDRWTPPSDKMQIFDVLGLEVFTTQIGMSELLKIDVSHLPAGVYFIRIGAQVEKFVKM